MHPCATDDTICAVSTPPGTGGIAVIRVSGSEAVNIVARIWKGKSLGSCASHTAHFGTIFDPEAGLDLDQCVVTLFLGPGSFTGEDMVEISVHGSVWIQQQLVRLLVRTGARLAAPGEFTRRAFANGRLDLAEAEAVADMIGASSRAAQMIAMSQLRGDFSRQIDRLRERLIDAASLIELELDFSEEDVEFVSREDLTLILDETISIIDQLTQSFDTGRAIRDGVPVAIVGATNAGKSSLLNALAGDDRAIVSDIHGTTRDTIEELIDISGIQFRIIDTAGLRTTDDLVEKMGIERSMRSIRDARVVVWIVDGTTPPSELMPLYRQINAIMSGESRLVLAVNKMDLVESCADAIHAKFDTIPYHVTISAATTEGMDKLKEEIHRASGLAENLTHSSLIITNQRHYEALVTAAVSLHSAKDALAAGISGELVALDLRQGIDHLSSILGKISSDTLLHTIFSRFCIGK